MVIFSHVKITCYFHKAAGGGIVKISSFRAKTHLVFHWCLYNNKAIYLLYLESEGCPIL